MLAGELRNFEEEFICAAMAMVGRVRELPLRAPQEAGDFREPLALGGAPRRAASHVSGVVGISRQGLRYASLEGEVCVARIEICMDCDGIVQWANGTWKLFNERYEAPLLQVMDKIALLRDFGCRPRGLGADWLTHIPRDENRRADQLAADPTDECRILHPLPWPSHLRVKTDGGSSRAQAGCGWELWGCHDASIDHGDQDWLCLAEASWLLPTYVLPIEAEFCGLLSFLCFWCRVVQEGVMGDGSGRCAPVREEWLTSGARPRLWERLAWRDRREDVVGAGVRPVKRVASMRQGEYAVRPGDDHDEARRQRRRRAEEATLTEAG